MKRKLLSIVLALCLTLTLLPTATLAAGSYADTNGHWAEAAIERWSGYGILQGADGKFSPDGTLTRAQMATILSRLLALPEASSYGFTDVAAGDWFADAIDRCAAAGIMQGTGGKAEPNAPITREQAMVMLCRALGIDAVAANLSGYPDGAQVSAYAAGYVAALVQMGIVKGDANGKLNPAGNITRAEIVTIIDRLITVYANVDGAVINAANGGTVLVTAKNVSIANAPEGTKVIAAKGADGLSVNGKPVAAGQTYIVPSSEDGTSYTPGTGTYVPHKHTYTYTDNGDGTHTGVCACGNSTVEEHTIKDGRCVLCRAVLTTDTVASVKNSDGTYTYFETLADAIAAAKDGDTVTVVSGGSENFVVPSGKDITLDLNGCEITTSKQPKIEEGGSLTIRGEGGSIILEEAGIYLEGSLTLESGKIESKKNSDIIFIMGNGNFTMTGGMLLADAGACIDASYLTNGVSRLNITGGVVETKDPSVNAIYINNRWGPGKIELTISGGTIKAAKQAAIALDDSVSTISLTGGTYSSNPSAYVADGYIARVNGEGAYVVSEVGTAANPYRLDEFNALAKLPAGRTEIYLDISDVSLANGDITIGNKDMADVYTSVTGDYTVGQELEDGRVVTSVWNESKKIYLANTNKPGTTLYISGSVKDNNDYGLNNTGDGPFPNSLNFVIPDASEVVFTKDFTVNGYFRCGFSWNDNTNLGGGVASHKIQSVLFDHSTFNGIWIQNGGFEANSLTLDGCTFNAYVNKKFANDSNPLWFCNIRSCDVTVKDCIFKASRPIKVVEQTVNGANVTITGNQFDMSLTNSADDESKPKNDAIMFSTITDVSTLGNVVVSGNTVTGATALLTFFNPSQITMADGATFTVSNNTLNNALLSVKWKSTTEYIPDFVTVTGTPL